MQIFQPTRPFKPANRSASFDLLAASPQSAAGDVFLQLRLTPADCGLGVDLFLHLECASDQADLLLWLCYHLDDVETKRDVGEIEQAKPFFGGANDSGSLAPIDRFMRCPEKLVRTSFDFDKNQDLFLTIAADEVNLAAAPRPEISIKDLEGLFP
jgi:hypothetical protein